jgi:hypothetical protein
MNFLEVFLVTGIVPIDSLAYQILVSFHFGGMTAFSVCLVMNGFVVFDLVREGSPLSLWVNHTDQIIIICANEFI